MLRERHDASHGTGGWGDFHLTLDTWFISQITRQITQVGRGLRPPVLRSRLCRLLSSSKECGRPHRVGPEPLSDPVEGLFRFPPARRTVTERELPRRASDRAEPGGPDADEPQPGPAVEPRALVEGARGRVDLPGH